MDEVTAPATQVESDQRSNNYDDHEPAPVGHGDSSPEMGY
jgi:hypothetical protein